jgi:hypothetical protein
MWTITIISILVGAVLGLRFKALVFVPIIGLALATIGVAGIAHGEDVWSLATTTVVVATFLQLGYFGASALQFGIGAARATDHRRASMPISTGGIPAPPPRNRVHTHSA